MKMKSLIVAMLAAFLWPVPGVAAQPGDMIPGPLEAEVLRVIDGDTFEARVFIWPGQTVTIGVRLAGVDAPEKYGRCRRERVMAATAEKRLNDLLYRGALLRNIRLGKYAGRVVAKVHSAGGTDVAEVLIGEGLGRRYTGGARESWCDQ